jgi:hypothetical protein
MRNAYVLDIQWAGRLRRKASFMPYENSDKTQSTFTSNDLLGSFTELLVQGYDFMAETCHLPR